MAVARLVMQQWKDEYNVILHDSDIIELLFGLYVDDGRTVHRKLYWGERFDPNLKKMVWDQDRSMVDMIDEVDRTELTRQEILIAMNSVNSDLQFTMELHTDFGDNRLPTLSFALWPEGDGLNHSYFEKEMRNQVLVVERSALSRNSIMAIMSNELRRRLEVLGESVNLIEKEKVINKYAQQLVNSEYNWKQIREIVVSGLTGYVRKENSRKVTKKPKFRSGQTSLQRDE